MPSQTSVKPGKRLPCSTIKALVFLACGESQETCSQEYLRLEESLSRRPGELEQIVLGMSGWDPGDLASRLAEESPSLPLNSDLEKQPPMEVLKALLRIAPALADYEI